LRRGPDRRKQLSAHLIIGFFVDDYRPVKNLIGLRQQPPAQVASRLMSTNADGTPILANATFVMLCRNSELEGVISSIRQIEDRFNKNYRYPWVLLNDEPFTEVFKE
jgi:alpha 1,2-mannosyltransferase